MTKTQKGVEFIFFSINRINVDSELEVGLTDYLYGKYSLITMDNIYRDDFLYIYTKPYISYIIYMY